MMKDYENEFFVTFRVDRKPSQKSKSGRVMLVIPKKPNPRLRKDLNHMNQEFFEGLWIECILFGYNSTIKQLVNLSCNPKKTAN